MQRLNYRDQRRASPGWSRFGNWLLYLPGAFIIVYGFWLTLNL